MIVVYTEKGWQVSTQRSHGLLAAQLCFHWKKENRPKRWLETVIATAEHDDATNELEAENLITENGGPVNFSMTHFDKALCTKLMGMAITKSKYIAVLTSRHICFLYASAEDINAQNYCKELKKDEKKWLKELGITSKEIEQTYHLLEWCDAFSLLICQQLIQPESRKIEISTGPDFGTYQFYAKTEHRLVVEPWPFDEESFEVIYESKTLEQLTYKNTQDFIDVYMNAKTQFHKYTIAKS